MVLNTAEDGDYMTVTGVRADGGGETSLTMERWAGVSEVAWSPGGGLVVIAHRQPLMPAQVWLIANSDSPRVS